MDKLLHERLREWAKDNCCAPVPIIALKDECNEAAIDAFTMIADEIERNYIPRKQYVEEMESKATDHMRAWAREHGMPTEVNEIMSEWLDRFFIPRPRFEDGTPLENGDCIDYNGRPEKVVSYLVAPEIRGDVGYGRREPYATLHLKCGASHNVPLGEPLRRPKVLDADGVPIKVGDGGWSTVSGTRLSPVSGFRYDEFGTIVQLDDGFEIEPFCFTHREPDSLEKLRDDMAEWYKVGGIHSINEYIDRLSAIIERGA